MKRLQGFFLVVLTLIATSAMADNFTLTATGAGINLNATVTGSTYQPGIFNITGMNGFINSTGIAGVLATTAPGVLTNSAVVNYWYIQYDNLLDMNAGHTFFDQWGLAFKLNDGTLANLFYDGGNLYAQLGNNPVVATPVDLRVAPVPEPASLMFFGSGVAGLALRLRKRRAARKP